MTTTRFPILALAAAILLPAGIRAQEGEAPPPPEPQAPPTQLVFEREVFTYPGFDRRNPFLALSADPAGGPRFEQIALRSIMWSSDPARSLALFSTGGGATFDPEAGTYSFEEYSDTRRIRRGESWGNMRVSEIRRDAVIVTVEVYGITETHEMRIERVGPNRGPGGGGS